MKNLTEVDGTSKKVKAILILEGAQKYMTQRICPICNKHYSSSEYLEDIFKDDPKALFIANLVTHYRHHHIQSWNRCWGRNGDYYRNKWFGDYEKEKQVVNERAKRQIIRKAQPKLIALGITSETFKKLQNTDEKTIVLAVKKLDGMSAKGVTKMDVTI